jgi:hypothetical protein
MSEAKRLGRRGFLGVSAATVGAGIGLGLVKLRPANEVRVVDGPAFPDAPVTAIVRFPDAVDGDSARVWLHARTPQGVVTRDLGRVSLAGGEARVETQLHYPFEGRVPGEYAYWFEAAQRGRRAVSDQPLAYSVRKIWWFS